MILQSDVLKQCLEDAAQACGPLVAQSIDVATAALQALELKSMKVAERGQLASAWRQLENQKTHWKNRFPTDMLAAFVASVAATPLTGTGILPGSKAASGSVPGSDWTYAESGINPLKLDSLKLVDDAHVAQAIDAQRLLQQILPGLEQKLAELDALISTALGLPNVMPEHNPLRPQEFTRVLKNLMAATADVDAALPPLWAKHLAAPIGQGLQTIYAKVVTQLESANVQAAQYRVLQTPLGSPLGRGGSGGSGGSGSGSGSGSETGAAGAFNGSGGGGNAGPGGGHGGGSADDTVDNPPVYADLSDQGVRQDFFDDFLFRGGNKAGQRLAPAYYEQIDEELAALSAQVDEELEAADQHSNYRHLPSVDRPQRVVNASSHLSTGAWGNYGKSRRRTMVRTQLKKEATQVSQVMGLEVVRQLVNQVAQDPRLLAPVREAIVALEPSLLRLAMVDPRFFGDERHVGRALMERTAQRSFKYNDEYSPEFFEFFEGVNVAFNTLNDSEVKNTQPFALALHTLESSWNANDQLEFEDRQAVLQALRFAEERQVKADEIAFDLSTRSDLDKVPGLILDFLFGPWALAMAHARLVDKRNQIDPEGYGSVVPDLIWSVKHESTLKQPAKFVAMLPRLLEKLHSGLALLGQTREEGEAFFEALMSLHQPVLKLRRLKTLRDAEESNLGSLGDAADDLELSEGQDGHDSHEIASTPSERLEKIRAGAQPLWMGREDLDAAGFEDTVPSFPVPLESDALPVAAAGATFVQQAAALNRDEDGTGTPGERSSLAPVLMPASAPATVHTSAREDAWNKEQAQAMVQGLRAGNWVDLYSKRRWLRAQLVWASTKSTLFMFLSHGGQPHSMTSRSCEKLVMQNLLRLVDTRGVVAQALNAVTQTNVAAPGTEADANDSQTRQTSQNLLTA
jgi:Protein of unknown function (DUF1631)